MGIRTLLYRARSCSTHTHSADKTVHEVKERLLAAKGNSGLDKVSTVRVGFLHQTESVFVKAAGERGCTHSTSLRGSSDSWKLSLPPNKDSLAFLILHLQSGYTTQGQQDAIGQSG